MAAMTDLQRYPAEVFWSDEDEGYIAIAPDLPGCSAWGADEATALRELRVAIAAWIDAAKAAGNPIPEPSRPADPEQYSGKFLIRAPRSLHANLSRAARKEGISLNQYVVYLLTAANAAETANKHALQNWTIQNWNVYDLPHYGGAVVYEKTFEAVCSLYSFLTSSNRVLRLHQDIALEEKTTQYDQLLQTSFNLLLRVRSGPETLDVAQHVVTTQKQ